ncbi:MAG: gamma carbonic anhydrase family protein [Chloroflexi bacterium]|nr:gamma carbonic anhydrase family protein [Chloroflexota bacterium]
MPIYEFEGKRPRIGPSSYVHPTAVIIGDVVIGERCWIGPNVTIRADLNQIRIADGSNLQDNVVVHGQTNLGPYSHVGHGAVIHGAALAEHVLVGINAILLDGVKIGEWCVIAAGSVVAPRAEVPPFKLVMGLPAAIVGEAPRERREGWDENNAYLEFTRRYPEGLVELTLEEAKGLAS